MAIVAIGGVLVSLGLLVFGVVTLLWNKLDKRFDDLKAEQNQRFDQVDKQLEKLEALILEALKTPR